MSANYWQSTQCRFWSFTKEQLATMRQKLEEDNAELVRMFPLPQQRHLYIYFNQRTWTPLYHERTDWLTQGTRRIDTAGEAINDSTTIHGHGAGLHEAILLQSRDSSNEPIPRHSDRDIPSLQNRRVSSTYSTHRDRGATDVGRSRGHRHVQAGRV